MLPKVPERATRNEGEAALYWEKAAECRNAAELAADSEVRNEWLDLANYWTTLLLRANDREIDPTTH
jgi:hypothetical protein